MNLTHKNLQKRLKEITPRKRKFSENVANGMDLKEAFLAAGYADNRSAMRNARNLYQEMRKVITSIVSEKIGSEVQAAKAYATIDNLSAEAKSESVRLQAATQMLDRTEFAQVKEVKFTHESKDMSNETLDARIAELRKELGMDAKDITMIEGDVIEVEAVG